MRLMHAKRCVQRSTAWAGQACEIVFDGRGVTRTTTADRSRSYPGPRDGASWKPADPALISSPARLGAR